jgi:hypothetical protein
MRCPTLDTICGYGLCRMWCIDFGQKLTYAYSQIVSQSVSQSGLTHTSNNCPVSTCERGIVRGTAGGAGYQMLLQNHKHWWLNQRGSYHTTHDCSAAQDYAVIPSRPPPLPRWPHTGSESSTQSLSPEQAPFIVAVRQHVTSQQYQSSHHQRLCHTAVYRSWP